MCISVENKKICIHPWCDGLTFGLSVIMYDLTYSDPPMLWTKSSVVKSAPFELALLVLMQFSIRLCAD